MQVASSSKALCQRVGCGRAGFQPCMLPPRPLVSSLRRPWANEPLPGMQGQQQGRGASSAAAAAPIPLPQLPQLPQVPALPAEPPRLGEAAFRALARSARAATRYGWISFALQSVLAVASTIVLLFSIAFTPQTGISTALWTTVLGIIASFVSCFWNFRYTRIGKRLNRFMSVLRSGAVPNKRVRKQDVVDLVVKGALINLLGFGTTLLGIATLTGTLVAQTISNATSTAIVTGMNDVYSPILVLDVFLVQAATNTLLGHFLSLVCSLWLLNIVGEGRGLRFQRFIGIQRLKRRTESNMVLSKGNALVFRINSDQTSSGSSRSSRDGGSRGGGGASAPTARPVVGAASTTAAVGFSAAARQMQAESARNSSGAPVAGAGLSVAGEMLQSLRSSGGASGSSPSSRPLLLPTQRSLRYLDGTLPGDQGFDPLGLFDPDENYSGVMSRDYLRYSEIIHSRWAMLGVIGFLVPDAFASWGFIDHEDSGGGWLAHAVQTLPLPLSASLLLLLGTAEARRLWDFTDPGAEQAASQSDGVRSWIELEEDLGLTSKATGDPAYPGGPVFNSLQLVRDASPSLFGYKEVELVNGRLAMVAFLGFVAQGALTGQGPYAALVDHLNDPVFHNFLFRVQWLTREASLEAVANGGIPV